MEDTGISINMIDGLAIGLTLLSGVLALFRGFTKEALQVGGWAAAFVVTAFALPYARPLALDLTGSAVAATPTAAAALFIGTLIICSLITSQIAGAVRKSQMSMLDRSLGFGFGLARGALLVCLVYIGFLLISDPKDVQKTVAEARTGQLIQLGADSMLSILPAQTVAALDLKDDIDAARPNLDAPPPPLDVVTTSGPKDENAKTQVSQQNHDDRDGKKEENHGSTSGYGQDDRMTIDSLIEESSKSE